MTTAWRFYLASLAEQWHWNANICSKIKTENMAAHNSMSYISHDVSRKKVPNDKKIVFLQPKKGFMQNRRSHLKNVPMLALLLLAMLVVPQEKSAAQRPTMSLDIFSGVEFGFRDIHYMSQYDIFISLTPAFKWNFGNHWQVAGQLYVDVINQYNDPNYDWRYISNRNILHFSLLDISKEFKLGWLHCKASAGFFSEARYGVDLKMFLPVADWFAFEAQAGLTGRYSTVGGWGISPMGRFAGTLGGDIYLARSNTQLRGVVGSYLYRDLGAEVEAIRHFRHSSVSLYANWNNKDAFDGGFRVVVMLPPYHRKQRIVNIRPASNFRLPYTIMCHEWTNRMYYTDPEQNERDGWFSRDFLDWGSHTMEPDFIISPKE